MRRGPLADAWARKRGLPGHFPLNRTTVREIIGPGIGHWQDPDYQQDVFVFMAYELGFDTVQIADGTLKNPEIVVVSRPSMVQSGCCDKGCDAAKALRRCAPRVHSACGYGIELRDAHGSRACACNSSARLLSCAARGKAQNGMLDVPR